MFHIEEDMTIHMTRGDVGYFSVSADSNGRPYTFKKGDVVRFKVFKKKDCSIVELQKDFLISEDAERVYIILTEEDTKIGDVISKPVDYWYEVELNPFTNPQTIIGYDDDGAKIFKLYPEGKDLVESELKEVPPVDSELSLTSKRPLQNQAVTRAIIAINEKVGTSLEKVQSEMSETKEITNDTLEKTKNTVETFGHELEVQNARLNALLSLEGGATDVEMAIADLRVGADGRTYPSAGQAVRYQFSKANGKLAEVDELVFRTISTTKVADVNYGYKQTGTNYAVGDSANSILVLKPDDNYFITTHQVEKGDIICVEDGITISGGEFNGIVVVDDDYIVKEILAYDELQVSGKATFTASGNMILSARIPNGAERETTLFQIKREKSIQTVYRATDYGVSTNVSDNTPALQALVDIVHENGGGTIYFPIGEYEFRKSSIVGTQYENSNIEYAAIWMKSNVSIIGENMRQTVFAQTEKTPYAMFGFQGTPDTPIVGCTYSDFTVNAYATEYTAETGNKVYSKAFAYQYVRDCRFDHLILKGTLATGLGIDFLDRVDVGSVYAIDCGRAFDESLSGRSGIGIGTGGWEEENFVVHDCICKGSGQYGIFIENQFNLGWGGRTDHSKGCIIRNCIVHSGMHKGIGVLSGENVAVIGCEVYENEADGIYIEGKCENVQVSANIIAKNGGNGVVVANKVEKHGSVSTIDKLSITNNMISSNAGDGIKLKPSAPLSNMIVDANKILSNKGFGINVSGDIDALAIMQNFAKGNIRPINVGMYTYKDCVIKYNIFFGDHVNVGVFTGETSFNELPVTEEHEIISVSISDFETGIKLSPDGSEAAQDNGFTTDFIDVSGFTSSEIHLRFSNEFSASYRVVQYRADKTSLHTEENPSPMIKAYTGDGKFIYEPVVEKLEGVAYIRIFLAGIKEPDFTVTIY